MKYSESEVMQLLRRLCDFYSESFPEDREVIERFIQWAHNQYGYLYQDREKS